MDLILEASRKARNLTEADEPLKAVFVNGTLKSSKHKSNTRALIDHVIDLIKEQDGDTKCEVITLADYNFSHGISYKREDDKDQWPFIYDKLKAADIIIVCSPTWFGARSSYIQKFFERLISTYSDTDDQGRYPLYNKVGGVIVTGNEDGAHSIVAATTGNLAHLGILIPPNCDTYWNGAAGAGPSYIQAGKKHLYTNKLASYLAHNLVYYGRLIKDNPNPINMKDLAEEARKISDESIKIEDPNEESKRKDDDS